MNGVNFGKSDPAIPAHRVRAAGCSARVEGYGSLMRLPHHQADLSARGTEAAL